MTRLEQAAELASASTDDSALSRSDILAFAANQRPGGDWDVTAQHALLGSKPSRVQVARELSRRNHIRRAMALPVPSSPRSGS